MDVSHCLVCRLDLQPLPRTLPRPLHPLSLSLTHNRDNMARDRTREKKKKRGKKREKKKKRERVKSPARWEVFMFCMMKIKKKKIKKKRSAGLSRWELEGVRVVANINFEILILEYLSICPSPFLFSLLCFSFFSFL